MDLELLERAPRDLYITEELARRPPTAPDHLREKQAIQDLASRIADDPEEVLPRFVDLAMALTGGVSAGLSLFEEQPAPGVFRWRYLRGRLAPFEDATTPRNFSPCGITLDRNAPVLSLHPERFYSWISDARIVVPEVLLVPLYLGEAEPAGTLWIVAGKEGHFNSEHVRIATELASLVGIALKIRRTETRLQDALQEQETLTREMSHRVKNLFMVCEGMVRMSVKGANSKEEMTEILTGRLRALAAAHGLIRRSFSPDGTAATVSTLGELIGTVLEPYERARGAGSPRFAISGPPVACGERALNGIALVVNELATNALKYGALAAEEGAIDISWAEENAVVALDWSERGGPGGAAAPQAEGFGSKLLKDTVELQFRGTLEQRWGPGELKVRVKIPANKLVY